MLQREDCFHQSCNAAGGFCVSEVCLHRAKQHRTIRGPAFSHHRRKCFNLDGIAQSSSRSVRFHVVDLRGIDARHIERLLESPLPAQAR